MKRVLSPRINYIIQYQIPYGGEWVDKYTTNAEEQAKQLFLECRSRQPELLWSLVGEVCYGVEIVAWGPRGGVK